MRYSSHVTPHGAAVLGVQSRLLAYILAFVPNRADADDILQETNAVLLRKQDEFTPGSDFWLWACKVAYYEVLSFRKRRQRNQVMLNVDEQTFSQLAEEAVPAFAHVDDRIYALRKCLEKFPASNREVILYRYQHGLSAEEIAEKVGQSPLAVRQLLFRIRAKLNECICRRISVGGA